MSNDTETDSKTLSLTISPSDNPLAPIISTLSLPSGTVSRDYTAEISAAVSGDASGMSWTIYSGTLPEGLNFEKYTGETITLSGTPKESGSFTFMMRAYINGYSDMQSFTVLINDLIAPKITTPSLPGGKEDTPYSAVVEASGTPPITWSIAGGKLPDGLSLSADAGIISGIPSVPGDYSFTISVMNDAGETSADFTVSIAPIFKAVSPDFTVNMLPEGRVGTAYSAQITVSGTEPLTISLSAGEIPEGLTFSNGLISGTPSRSGTFSLTFTVSNIAGSVSKTFVLTINSAPEPVKSDDKKPGGQTESEDKKPEEDNIVVGPARGVASLSAVELARVSNDRSMIAAILPEMAVNVSDLYTFEGITINSNVPAGYALVWNPFARVSASEMEASAEGEAMFMDENGREITRVQESRIIGVSAYLEAGRTYAPVISAVISEDQTSGVGNSNGGCALFPGILLLAALGLFAGKKQ